MFEILREGLLMMILRKKIVEKEAWLGINMWIDRVSDILYVKSNKLSSPVDTHCFFLHPCDYH